jgi:predicted esterase
MLHAGVPIDEARLVVILLHGRGASAEGILGLSREIRASDLAFLAPQAAGHTWYPQTFLAPIPENEPHLGSALRLVATSIADLAGRGVPAERVALMGFSQGACLSLELAARHATRYAAVIALSGGLIGPPGTPRDYAGSLDGTPVFIGCSDVDAHIPLERVHESTAVLRRLGASVDERIYPGMGHTITRDELDAVDTLLAER